MLVQYVVGLCALRNNTDAVDVTVGDLVLDTAARKRRDVDVTVTLKEEDGSTRAFKAYEVKQEGKPLDVASVEQLCAKLRDMPDVTHRAIVSATNFSDGAINKAAAYDVALFVLKPWTKPIAEQFPDFPNVGRPDDFLRSFESSLLYWIDVQLHVFISYSQPIIWDASTPVFTARGGRHRKIANMGQLTNAMLQRSTEILFQLQPAQTVLRTFPCSSVPNVEDFEAGPAWPHTHTLQVESDKCFLKFDDKFYIIHTVTINGNLQWRKRKRIPQFYVIEDVSGHEVFAGAALADYGSDDGKMFAMIFPAKSRTLGLHQFQLNEKQRNMIRKLKIPLDGA